MDAPISGTAFSTPEVASVRLGSPLSLTVRMLPGTTPDQLTRVGRRIAPALGGMALRVEDRGHGWCIVTVLAVDPLAAGTVPLPTAATSALDALISAAGKAATRSPCTCATPHI